MAQDSVLIKYEQQINYCDSMFISAINQIIAAPMPEDKELKTLAQLARMWQIRKEDFIEAKRVFEKHYTKK